MDGYPGGPEAPGRRGRSAAPAGHRRRAARIAGLARDACLPVFFALAACTRAEEPAPQSEEAPVGEGPASALVTTLQVQVDGDTAHLVLHVTNPLDEGVGLSFPTAQRYDFHVLDEGGTEVWRWSADRSFAQVLGSDTIAPGGTVSYEADWPYGERRGRFEAVGRLATPDAAIEQRAAFDTPGAGG